jgi:hypothetical protein
VAKGERPLLGWINRDPTFYVDPDLARLHQVWWRKPLKHSDIWLCR